MYTTAAAWCDDYKNRFVMVSLSSSTHPCNNQCVMITNMRWPPGVGGSSTHVYACAHANVAARVTLVVGVMVLPCGTISATSCDILVITA